MRALAADLERFLADGSVRAAQGDSVLRLRSWVLRYPAAIGLGAAGVMG